MEGRRSAGVAQEEKNENEDDLYLDSFNCPILREPFKEPVMAEDGHTYELSAFQQWVARKKASPLTGYPLRSTATQDNYVMKKAVQEYERDVLPRLKRLKELEPQVQHLEALKAAERTRLQKEKEKEKEIERLKRVEKAFYEQKLTLEGLVKREEEERRLILAQDAEIMRLRQVNQIQQVYSNRTRVAPPAFFAPQGARSIPRDEREEKLDLMRAIQNGQVSGVKAALNAGADVDQRFGPDRATPLILAIRLYPSAPKAAQKIIEMLCERQARLDLPDGNGDRPLHWAASLNLIWPVAFLLERRANPCLKNKAWQTPSEKLLKHPYFNSSIMNKLLRAESRNFRFEGGGFRQARCREERNPGRGACFHLPSVLGR